MGGRETLTNFIRDSEIDLSKNTTKFPGESRIGSSAGVLAYVRREDVN